MGIDFNYSQCLLRSVEKPVVCAQKNSARVLVGRHIVDEESALAPPALQLPPETVPLYDSFSLQDAVVHGFEDDVVDFRLADTSSGNHLRVVGRLDDGVNLGDAAAAAKNHQTVGGAKVSECPRDPEAMPAMHYDGLRQT